MSSFISIAILMAVLAIVINVGANHYHKDCVYCERRQALPSYGTGEHAEVRIVYGDLLYISQPKSCVKDTAIEVNYCPICGRKLGD